MIKYFYCFSILLFTQISWAKSTLDKSYPAQEIAPNVWVIHGPTEDPNVKNQGFMNNPAFIVGDKSVIVIDAGSTVQVGRMVLEQIKKVTDKPISTVLTTHIHGDHWLANDAIYQAYPKAHFYAHPRMIQRAKNGEAKNWLAIMDKATDHFSKPTKAVIPNLPLNDGDTLTVDNIDFLFHAVDKAHSDTDLMIEVVKQHVFFLGDNVTYQRFGRLDDATFAGNIKACERAIQSKATIFVPGHGATKDVKIVKLFKNYLTQVYQLASKYYEDDLAPYEMKPLIIKALPAIYKNWAGFDQQIGKHIIIAVQEIEQNEF